MHINRPVLPDQQSHVLRLLRSEGSLSRWQLHERTRLRPNTVGEHVAQLLETGLVCERSATSRGRGRPRVPLSIDPLRLHVVGAAIRPGHVEACRLNLLGRCQGRVHTRGVKSPGQTIATLERLLGDVVNDQTFLIGLSTTGFVDPAHRRILFSSALPGIQSVSLDSLLHSTGDRPVVVDNDMHALAARWLQEHHHPLGEDVLLIYFDDGQLGAALLVRGEPNRGCLVGGNELGHTRLPVETELCYCGHGGCIERICSADFLRRQGAGDGPLLEHIARYDGTQTAVGRMIDLLATGLANPVNFVRPHRVVLVSTYTRYSQFIQDLLRAIRSRIMIELVGRVRFDFWDQAATRAGENAGWLALAAVYYPAWTKTILETPEMADAEAKAEAT
jgi:predicted NBD/HSP70 family sugar kinase